MAVTVSGTAPRQVDRVAMRRLLDEHGFEHAVGSLAQAVSVELVNAGTRNADEHLGQMAGHAEAVVLDALVHFARSNGWRGAR